MNFATRQFSSSALAAAKRLPSFAGIPSVDMKKYTQDLGEYRSSAWVHRHQMEETDKREKERARDGQRERKQDQASILRFCGFVVLWFCGLGFNAEIAVGGDSFGLSVGKTSGGRGSIIRPTP
jgi:hypothetical protein